MNFELYCKVNFAFISLIAVISTLLGLGLGYKTNEGKIPLYWLQMSAESVVLMVGIQLIKMAVGYDAVMFAIFTVSIVLFLLNKVLMRTSFIFALLTAAIFGLSFGGFWLLL